jgi:hypothetical protein
MPEQLYAEDLEQRLSNANLALRESTDNVQKLHSLHATALAKIQALDSERKSRSYEALSGGDARQIKALDLINAHFLTAHIEAENYGHAIDEAQTRVRAAQVTVTAVNEQLKCTAALVSIQEMKQAALECDAALSDFLRSYRKLTEVSTAVRNVTGGPNRDSVRVYSKRCLATALLSEKLTFDLEQLAPRERSTYSEICEKWADLAEHHCRAKLNGAAE